MLPKLLSDMLKFRNIAIPFAELSARQGEENNLRAHSSVGQST